MKNRLVAVAAGAALVAGIVTVNAADANTPSAKARLVTAHGQEIGTVTFKTEKGHTNVKVRLTAAPGVDAFHGFHIHANDVATNGDGCIANPNEGSPTWFVSADGHYNPSGQTHSHHVGDMPVVYVNADGSVETKFRIDKINPGDLNGKVVILHAGADNYANIPIGPGATQYSANTAEAIAATAKTGNAGDRLACGVIMSS